MLQAKGLGLKLCVGMLLCTFKISFAADTDVKTTTFKGSVKARVDVQQQPLYALSQEHTMATAGVVGLLFANLTGVQKHSKYVIFGGPDQVLRMSSVELYQVGDCIELTGPSDVFRAGTVEVGLVTVAFSTGCLIAPPDPPVQELPIGEVPKKTGRPN